MKKIHDTPIADLLQRMIKEYKLEPNLKRANIESLWEQKMGSVITTYTRQLRVHKNVLYVTIESASLRSELHFGREKIRLLLNEAMGEDYLKEVVIN